MKAESKITPEHKTMVSLRVADSLIGRVDFVAKNTTSDALATRSAVIQAAIEAWLPIAEAAIKKSLGDGFFGRK